MYAGMGGRQAPSSRLTSADRYGESLGVHAEIVAIDTNELSCVHARASAPMDAADPLASDERAGRIALKVSAEQSDVLTARASTAGSDCVPGRRGSRARLNSVIRSRR